MVASMRTIDDVLPPDQDAKRDEVEAIRHKMTPKLRARLTPDDKRRLDQLLGSGPLAPIREDRDPRRR